MTKSIKLVLAAKIGSSKLHYSRGIAIGIILCSLPVIARAQSGCGSGGCPEPWFAPKANHKSSVGGSNRVVSSPPGYGAAKGEFILHGPMELNLPDGANPNRDHPTFYLGATVSGTEIDAGVAYEPLLVGGRPPGWREFMALSVVPAGSAKLRCYRWVEPKVNNNQPTISDVKMEFVFGDKGSVALTTDGFPDLYENVMVLTCKPVDIKKVRMKRVIGLTQSILKGGGIVPDGSYFLHTEFKNGRLRQWGQDSDLADYGDHWPSVGSSEVIVPKDAQKTNPGGARIVNMDPPWTRLEPSGADIPADQHSPNRFTQEIVNIDYRSAEQIQKKQLQNGKQSGDSP